jgi:hypothetical protein
MTPRAAGGQAAPTRRRAGRGARPGPGGTASDEDLLAGFLNGLDADALRGLLREFATDAGIRRALLVRAAASVGTDADLAATLTASVKATLTLPRRLDRRQSTAYAAAAAALLDELEGHLAAGRADATREPLQEAAVRLRKVVMNVYDDAGLMGACCQRAADLHVRACREGAPNVLRLAKWLTSFRTSSPGWPRTDLASYADLFDERAMAAYRAGIDSYAVRLSGAREWDRRMLHQLQVELADHDGDVDGAIAVLRSREHPAYDEILERLDAAGRTDDALALVDEAVRAERYSARAQLRGHWLSPDAVSDHYLAAGRVDDALAFARTLLVKDPSTTSLAHLLRVGSETGTAAAQKNWATSWARDRASRSSGDVLIDWALAAGDLEEARAVALEFGAGAQWSQLSTALEATHPKDAADLHRPRLADDLRYPDTRTYPEIAERLATMLQLYARAGLADEFIAEIRGIRAQYANRPSLQLAMDAAALPR